MNEGTLHKYIWQWGDKSLIEVIFEKLQKKGLTLSFAESCTGGLLSNIITDISNSSSVFKGSIIAYHNQTKINILNVSKEILKKKVQLASKLQKKWPPMEKNFYKLILP